MDCFVCLNNRWFGKICFQNIFKKHSLLWARRGPEAPLEATPGLLFQNVLKSNVFVAQYVGNKTKEELNAPLLFNLRRDPYEKTAEESGMYTKWMGKKMWAFGPAKNLVVQHIQTLKQFPPRGSSLANQAAMQRQATEDNGLAQ